MSEIGERNLDRGMFDSMSNWPETLRKHKWKRSPKALVAVDAKNTRAFKCERCELIMQFEDGYYMPPAQRRVIFVAINPSWHIGEIYVHHTYNKFGVWQLEHYCAACECNALAMNRALK